MLTSYNIGVFLTSKQMVNMCTPVLLITSYKNIYCKCAKYTLLAVVENTRMRESQLLSQRNNLVMGKNKDLF